jgi:ATP-dependent DNA helicase RecQ
MTDTEATEAAIGGKPALAATETATETAAEAAQGKTAKALRQKDRRIRAALTKNFGLKQLREGQRAVIDRVLAAQNTLAVMPTGAGKSLCYQLPALLLAGRTVVVSPLIALMKDQCESLRARGIEAVQVNSAVDAESLHAAEEAIADGTARIVLTTPERLADADFMALLQRQPTSLLVVDEAHCISQWGHDFRPAFLEIAPAHKKLGKPTVLALTATATDAVTADIREQLGIAKSGVVNTGAYRPNLHYRVEQVAREQDKLARVLALVSAAEGSGLVYTATVKAADAVYEALVAADIPALRYHGKLGAAERRAAQDAFMEGRVRVMVATNAFGLGIDKADIRFVLHYQMPAGLDAYYQE